MAISANSGAGDVLVKHGTGNLHLKLVLPPDVAGTFHLDAGVGSISLPPSLGIEVKKKGHVGSEAHGSVGQGGATYKLNSGAGSLTIELR